MECAICYNKFFIPKNGEELIKLIEENVKNNNFNEQTKFMNLVITPKHNTTHTCSTVNCNCIICDNCWIKILCNGKTIDEAELDDLPNIYSYFKCPYCRQIDWKEYMNNVFMELKQKILPEDEFLLETYNRLFPKEFN